MSRINRTVLVLSLFTLNPGCKKGPDLDGSGSSTNTSDYGVGGPQGFLTLPFKSGEYWMVTQKYKGGSHVDYGFQYGDDSYALDFAQAGCESFGKPVRPMARGTVKKVYVDGDGDHGYGNSVLIDHGNGFISRYAHFEETWVTEGEYVTTSDSIGSVGNTGYVFGSACPDYPGTHLHVALYEDGEGVVPEPISGTDVEVGCWYNREGEESCSGNPGDYEGSDDEDDGDDWDSDDLNVRMLEVSPPEGVEDDTDFVWATVVSSPDGKPDVDLVIYNERDDHAYHFEMETDSEESPYIFTYRKSLRDSGDYEFWIEAERGSDKDRSGRETVEVKSYGDPPSFMDFDYSPDDGEAGDTEFIWGAIVRADEEPDLTLKIVNPADAHIYSFPMEVEHDSSTIYVGQYEKELNDKTVYSFWVEAESSEGNSASTVGSIEVH